MGDSDDAFAESTRAVNLVKLQAPQQAKAGGFSGAMHRPLGTATEFGPVRAQRRPWTAKVCGIRIQSINVMEVSKVRG